MEGYYDNTIFHRVVKGFIAQGGDPTGTGEGNPSLFDVSLSLPWSCSFDLSSPLFLLLDYLSSWESFFRPFLLLGGESIYGKPFNNEYHQRIRFIRRGIVGMANSGPNTNRSQFFFTLDRADELNKTHTAFGKAISLFLFSPSLPPHLSSSLHLALIFPSSHSWVKSLPPHGSLH